MFDIFFNARVNTLSFRWMKRVDVLDKNPATTVVVIDEVNTDNWGIGDECVTEFRKRS